MYRNMFSKFRHELCFKAFGLSFENAVKNLSSMCQSFVFYSITLSNLKDGAAPYCQCVVHCCFDGIIESSPKNVNVDFSFMGYLMGCCLHLHEQYYECRNLIEKCLFDSGVMDWTQYHRYQQCTVMTAGALVRVIWLNFYIHFVFLSSFCWPLSHSQAS